jgi:hypothetical protein
MPPASPGWTLPPRTSGQLRRPIGAFQPNVRVARDSPGFDLSVDECAVLAVRVPAASFDYDTGVSSNMPLAQR